MHSHLSHPTDFASPASPCREHYVQKRLAERKSKQSSRDSEASEEGKAENGKEEDTPVVKPILPPASSTSSQQPSLGGKSIDTEEAIFENLLTAQERRLMESEDREKQILLQSEAAKIESLERGDRWLTGIQEINLPVKYKLANIEETERAKAELMMKKLTGKKRGRDRGAEGAAEDGQKPSSKSPLGDGFDLDLLPSNFNADYKRHKRGKLDEMMVTVWHFDHRREIFIFFFPLK